MPKIINLGSLETISKPNEYGARIYTFEGFLIGIEKEPEINSCMEPGEIKE